MERTFTIKNKLGLHARAAAKLVQLMSRFESECFITKDSDTVNGKSIMGVLTLAAAMGTEITVRVDGPDEEEALMAIEQLIDNKFDES